MRPAGCSLTSLETRVLMGEQIGKLGGRIGKAGEA